MNPPVTITDFNAKAAEHVRKAEETGVITITRQGHPIAYLISRDKMESILETLDILANPAAMKAIRDYEAGEMTFKDVTCLD